MLGYGKKQEGIMNKYNNKKIEIDGFTFDSKAEGRRYNELKILQRAGEIKYFNLQPSFKFECGTRYLPDFIICDKNNKIWVEDVKGVETAVFKVKKKMFEREYPYLKLVLVK